MTDPTQDRQPTEEELRAYLAQLREADVTGIVAQVYEMLGTTAEVKLGRPDARLLIDTMTAVVNIAADALPSELSQRMGEGIAQLQMAQVQAERQGDEPAAPEGQAGDAQPGPSDKRMTDRLWIPGRGQEPPAPAR